ncbi:acetyltransferase [uncultured Bacteroides sp.]|uniref:acetyltransferase n=1 Tax=uncultured Bacteroides sp. TaxID=162156 RepID=UPI00262A1487|nr:acetyltransferase [uncultured Bacteroides sp.]
MFLYGASGHAKVIIDILKANRVAIEGLVDDNPNLSALLEFPVFHSLNPDMKEFIISIGRNRTRKLLAEKLAAQQAEFLTAVHPSAVLSEYAKIGEGTVVMQGAVVQSCTQIGRHCIVNTGARIDHECRIGDFVHVSPGATLCGNVTVGEGSWIGAGSTVIQGVRIGRWCMIGAGSVVTRNIPDGVLAVGCPCRAIKEYEP